MTTPEWHRNVHEDCPACGGGRCKVYATESQAECAIDQEAIGAMIEAGEWPPQVVSRGRRTYHLPDEDYGDKGDEKTCVVNVSDGVLDTPTGRYRLDEWAARMEAKLDAFIARVEGK